MFEYYQVIGIHFEFVPFRAQGNVTIAGSSQTTIAFPNYSCLTPDDIPITQAGVIAVPGALASFDNR